MFRACPATAEPGLAHELEGTVGPIAYIDSKDEGLRRLIALHEIAHLLLDSEQEAHGHVEEWVSLHARLIARHLGPTVETLWRAAYEESLEQVQQIVAARPDWPS